MIQIVTDWYIGTVKKHKNKTLVPTPDDNKYKNTFVLYPTIEHLSKKMIGTGSNTV